MARVCILVVALLAAPGAASEGGAAQAPDGGPERAGSALPFRLPSCVLRTYSREHLAKNPKQMVTKIRLDGSEPGSQELGGETVQTQDFQLTVWIRGDASGYRGGGYCIPSPKDATSLQCGIEGDGGTFVVQRKGDTFVVKAERFGGLDRVIKRPVPPGDEQDAPQYGPTIGPDVYVLGEPCK